MYCPDQPHLDRSLVAGAHHGTPRDPQPPHARAHRLPGHPVRGSAPTRPPRPGTTEHRRRRPEPGIRTRHAGRAAAPAVRVGHPRSSRHGGRRPRTRQAPRSPRPRHPVPQMAEAYDATAAIHDTRSESGRSRGSQPTLPAATISEVNQYLNALVALRPSRIWRHHDELSPESGLRVDLPAAHGEKDFVSHVHPAPALPESLLWLTAECQAGHSLRSGLSTCLRTARAGLGLLEASWRFRADPCRGEVGHETCTASQCRCTRPSVAAWAMGRGYGDLVSVVVDGFDGVHRSS